MGYDNHNENIESSISSKLVTYFSMFVITQQPTQKYIHLYSP